jgi:broad specificity phosphatase PhoE
MTRFIVVRHGETQWNIEARIQGHGDSALTEGPRAGRRDRAAPRGRSPSTRSVASDLGRAMQTAARIGAHR